MPNTVDYGFINVRHLSGQRVSNIGATVMRDLLLESAREYNRQLDSMLGSLVTRTTMATERVYIPGAGTLQPLDDEGNPLPVRSAGYYDVGFPIQGAGTAWGNNRVTRALMTVDEVARETLTAQRMDADWVRRHILGAFLDNTTWPYSDPLLGSITVQPFANGDTVAYPRIGGSSSTDGHYLAQTAAIADATNPYTTIYDELAEHPGNAGPYVAYIASNLVTTTQALALFVDVADPDIQLGANESSVAAGANIMAFGDRVLGKVSNMWIVEWRALPSNYILGMARGAGAPIGMREYDDPALQGFFPETHTPDGNHFEYRWLRYAGFGVRNRVAAVAYQVSGGDTTYDIPTGYSTPLPV